MVTWTTSPVTRLLRRDSIRAKNDMSEEESHTAPTLHDKPLEDPRIFIAAVAMHLPSFWPTNPRIWFAQVEAQVSRWGITTLRTKYEEIVCALPKEYATVIQDLLLDPPNEEPYEKLNQQLITCVVDSEGQKIRQLLMAEGLGDSKPSQLLRKMQLLLGEKAKMIDSSLYANCFATTPS